jgi:hypothetical protein
MKTKGGLTLDIETLRELTPEDAQSVNGGAIVTSSALPSPATGFKPTPTAVSSAKPPVHHKKKHYHHHQTVSSVMPTPPVHI